MKIEIRHATYEDAIHIALLGRITFTETFGHLFPIQAELDVYLSDTFSVQKIRSSLLKENNVFGLVLVDDLPVGYGKFKKKSWFDDADTVDKGNPDTIGEGVSQLQKIYILKDFLRLKLGFPLYQHIENQAIENKSNTLWLVVLHTNHRAIQFYEKLGFKKNKLSYFDIGSQHFQFELMVKKL